MCDFISFCKDGIATNCWRYSNGDGQKPVFLNIYPMNGDMLIFFLNLKYLSFIVLLMVKFTICFSG